MTKKMTALVVALQSRIVRELENVDGKKFTVDKWSRKEGGYGISCILQEGNVFEKAGVNVSVVHGTLPKAAVDQMKARKKNLDGDGPQPFFAAGISLVLHPHNPMAPTVHLNYRYFELLDPTTKETRSWWFGGGCDLTPSYLFEEDAKHFHQTIKETCDRHNSKYHKEFKDWCDQYFYLPHRQEARGIGGIFFDDLDDAPQEEIFEFVKDLGRSFIPSYLPIIKKRMNMLYTAEHKHWQQLRRGRYVEFNLIHDRGTKFGLATPSARTESILMSLPLTARWEYMHSPEKGSREEELVKVLKAPRSWV